MSDATCSAAGGAGSLWGGTAGATSWAPPAVQRALGEAQQAQHVKRHLQRTRRGGLMGRHSRRNISGATCSAAGAAGAALRAPPPDASPLLLHLLHRRCKGMRACYIEPCRPRRKLPTQDAHMHAWVEHKALKHSPPALHPSPMPSALRPCPELSKIREEGGRARWSEQHFLWPPLPPLFCFPQPTRRTFTVYLHFTGACSASAPKNVKPPASCTKLGSPPSTSTLSR